MNFDRDDDPDGEVPVPSMFDVNQGRGEPDEVPVTVNFGRGDPDAIPTTVPWGDR